MGDKPRFFIEKEPTDIAIIEDRETLKHIKVLRLKKGDSIFLLTGKCLRFEGVIEGLNKSSCIVKIIKKERLKPPPLSITLVQGLCKHPKMELVVNMVSGFSIKRIIPFIAKRSASKGENIERLRKIAESSFLTSRSGLLPEITDCLPLSKAIEMTRGDNLILIPFEEERKTHLKSILSSHKEARSISIFIGPEGGFEKEEVKEVEKIGGISTSLGDTIIKTEYAGFFVISSILYEFSPLYFYSFKGS